MIALAFLDVLGGPEIMLILAVVLIFFGGEKLPGFARGLGKAMRELKKATSEVENEFRKAMEESEQAVKKGMPELPKIVPNPNLPSAHSILVPSPPRARAPQPPPPVPPDDQVE